MPSYLRERSLISIPQVSPSNLVPKSSPQIFSDLVFYLLAMMNPFKRGLSEVLSRITNKLQQDSVVNITLHELRDLLRVDRVVLYYFYKQWQGQVTFEAISDRKYSIIGSTGPDDCFNVDYALLYLAGRINSIDDIEKANISDCHRDFLRGLLVRSNLVAPVLSKGKLWGLLVAHQCHDLRAWQPTDIEAIRKYSDELATAPSIRDYTN